MSSLSTIWRELSALTPRYTELERADKTWRIPVYRYGSGRDIIPDTLFNGDRLRLPEDSWVATVFVALPQDPTFWCDRLMVTHQTRTVDARPRCTECTDGATNALVVLPDAPRVHHVCTCGASFPAQEPGW